MPKIVIGVMGAPLVIAAMAWQWWMKRGRNAINSRHEIVLILSQVAWDEVWQRPQEYARWTSKTRAVIYCCPVQVHNLLTLGSRWRPVKIQENLVIISPLVFSGHFKNHLIFRANCRIISAYIKRLMPPSKAVRVVINTPLLTPVLEQLYYPGGLRSEHMVRLVYDLIDDFAAFEWFPAWAAPMESRILEFANNRIAGTKTLAEKHEAQFIGLGVDYNIFTARTGISPRLANLPGPVLGYVGTISERLDLRLIEDLAVRFPSGSIVMVGPVHLSRNELPLHNNIHYMGLQKHQDLPAIMRGFDAGLIPFRQTRATITLNPVKLLEYLAAGIPVVSTNLPDVEALYGELVWLAHTREEFILQVEKALTEDNTGRKCRGQQMAQQTSWENMTEKMNEVVFRDSIGSRQGLTDTGES